MFEYNPLLLDCCHVIPLMNLQSEITRPVNNHKSDIHGLKLCLQIPGDVGKLEELFDSG